MNHDAVIPQGIVADAVKLPGEVPLGGAEGIGGVYDDQIILACRRGEAQGVVKVDMYPLVVQAAGIFRQIAPAGLHYLFVHLHQIDGADGLIPGQLLDDAAVSRADDQHILHIGVDRHGHMRNHLVVNDSSRSVSITLPSRVSTLPNSGVS